MQGKRKFYRELSLTLKRYDAQSKILVKSSFWVLCREIYKVILRFGAESGK